jgi:hypothetical protein
MCTFQIKSYRPGFIIPDNTLYILAKGNNAGKPLDQPCPNCFALTTNSYSDKIKIYWVCHLLWQAGLFRRLLIGSVIPFIRIGELRNCIIEALQTCNSENSSFAKTVESLENIARLEQLVITHLNDLRKIKSSVARSLFQPKTH